MLTYVITVPVGSRGNCEVIKLIAVSIALGNKEFMYIDTEESILRLDQFRQYYFMINKAELCHCKTTTTGSYVCTVQYSELQYSTVQ